MVFTLKTGVYLHTAYAQASDGSVGFSTTSATDAAYLGQYTDASATDATDPSRYTWTPIDLGAGAELVDEAGEEVDSLTCSTEICTTPASSLRIPRPPVTGRCRPTSKRRSQTQRNMCSGWATSGRTPMTGTTCTGGTVRHGWMPRMGGLERQRSWRRRCKKC